jgi:hypothetical protein
VQSIVEDGGIAAVDVDEHEHAAPLPSDVTLGSHDASSEYTGADCDNIINVRAFIIPFTDTPNALKLLGMSESEQAALVCVCFY